MKKCLGTDHTLVVIAPDIDTSISDLLPLLPVPMAIAHVATEYVFSDFLLKDPTESKYKGLRLELALDKIVSCLAVGLPLFLISLAFAQEVSVGELDTNTFISVPHRQDPPQLCMHYNFVLTVMKLNLHAFAGFLHVRQTRLYLSPTGLT